jgi:hypothetical protein
MSVNAATAEPTTRSKRMRIPREGPLDPEQSIEVFRRALDRGDDWYSALLAVIGRWGVAEEEVDGVVNRYLIGGEAFDWLLLAERLLNEVADLVPADEADRLLFEEKLPLDLTEADFQRLLGAKYKSHLNFVYGVRVESALKLAVAEEVLKEHSGSRVWENGHADDESFTRIYGRPRDEMLAEFRTANGISDPEWLSLAELSEWRYWLFQYRVKNCDPARVASDTRKGLAFLQHLERARHKPAEVL